MNWTATLIAKNFGEIPAAGPLTAEDEALLAHVEAAFDTVGDLIGRHRQKQAIGEAMRVVAEVNKYVSTPSRGSSPAIRPIANGWAPSCSWSPSRSRTST